METINKMKRQLSEWEKIIASEATINRQNIQAVHAAQYQKNKQPNKKMVRRSKYQTFVQRRHRDG